MSRFADVTVSYADSCLSLALDTLEKGRQALVFCNTKRGAESQAEKIAQKVKSPPDAQELERIAQEILDAVQSPTKQCLRLAACVRKGIAFHHSGLHSKQRELVETRFRDGTIKIISATPTLAMGMDLPAYRSIIRDLKRYTSGTSWGMADIPVLEYEQMAGRAGRPGKESVGEAICIAESESEKERIVEKYILGDPEDIYSKLAVEPVLRTYVLSLVASGYVHDTRSLYAFFDETFYAWQYEDTDKLHAILDKMIHLLVQWEFVDAPGAVADDFAVASDISDGALKATPLGERVAQLYLDPYTANHLLVSIEQGMRKNLSLKEFPLLHLIVTTLEMRPLLGVRQSEIDVIDQRLLEVESHLFVKPPTIYSPEYGDFLQTVKTTVFLEAWVNETGEDVLFSEYNVTPGELQNKRSIADWLLYSLVELAKLKKWHSLIVEFEKMRVRLEYGAREEILPLLRLKGIGRIRARKLFHNGIKSIEALKSAEVSTLKALIGEAVAVSIKEQVGQKVDPEEISVKRNKRKGQINLEDFKEKEES
jgi:helicase